MSDTNDAVQTGAVSTTEKPLLVVDQLKTYFPIRSGLLQRVTSHFKAVDGVSFQVHAGEIVGLLGYSGYYAPSASVIAMVEAILLARSVSTSASLFEKTSLAVAVNITTQRSKWALVKPPKLWASMGRPE